MVPKFANPHSLSQDVEKTTRLEIAERAGLTPVSHDEDRHFLKRDLDNLLRDTWADALAETSSPSRAKKRRKRTEGRENEHGELVFRLVSSAKQPQRISLDPKPLPPVVSREPDCEDDAMQADVRRIRALSVAVEFESLGKVAVSKPVTVETKVLLAHTPLPRPLPPFFVAEEVRATTRVKARHPQATAPSPHEPQPSCVVLPVVSVPDKREMSEKQRRKAVKERPPPAYWRPSPDVRGKCAGHALGYPSSWAPGRVYVRDAMKRGVEST